jgi:hypothetical protein
MNMFSVNLVYLSKIESIIYDLYFCGQLQLLHYHNKFLHESLEHFILFFPSRNTIYFLQNVLE